MTLYSLEQAEVTNWGDYGSVLVSGIAYRHEGLLQLERTGPFVPPITLPNETDVFVTDSFKLMLEGSGLSGLTVRPAIKKRIVFSDWDTWDWTANEPQEYPPSGEPEDYISGMPHAPQLAEQIGTIWEASIENHAVFIPYQGLANWDGTDWFRASGATTVYVSDRARIWLEQRVSEWVMFKQVSMAD